MTEERNSIILVPYVLCFVLVEIHACLHYDGHSFHSRFNLPKRY